MSGSNVAARESALPGVDAGRVAAVADEAAIPMAWLVTGLAASFIGSAGLMIHAGLRLHVDGELAGLIALYLAVSGFILVRCRNAQAGAAVAWREATAGIALFAGVCVLGAVTSYAVAAGTSGYRDAMLQAADRALRFDWPAWYAEVAGHPLLQELGRAAYHSIFVTPAVLLVSLAVAGRAAEARRFVLSFWIAGVVTLAAFHYLPARGPLATLVAGAPTYLPVSGLYQVGLFTLLRAGSLGAVELGSLCGMVGAPSFHAASALLYIAAAWPHRLLRWPLTLLNVAMLVATPVEGTHYLIDLIGGAMVAALALAAAGWVARQAAARATGSIPRAAPSPA